MLSKTILLIYGSISVSIGRLITCIAINAATQCIAFSRWEDVLLNSPKIERISKVLFIDFCLVYGPIDGLGWDKIPPPIFAFMVVTALYWTWFLLRTPVEKITQLQLDPRFDWDLFHRLYPGASGGRGKLGVDFVPHYKHNTPCPFGEDCGTTSRIDTGKVVAYSCTHKIHPASVYGMQQKRQRRGYIKENYR